MTIETAQHKLVSDPQTIAQGCRNVLLTAEPRAKLMRARQVARGWRCGKLRHEFDVAISDWPDWPARPDHPELLPPNQMPKRGRAGSQRARVALLHALAHIEFVAIDLAFDMVGRFGAGLPREFVDDWLSVGADEAMHFALLDRRLRQYGSHYGALPAHGGLWEAAIETKHDLLARLAIVPMVLEARGLDVTPITIARLQNQGDDISAKILDRIFRDEIHHVSTGTKWFEIGCKINHLEIYESWQTLVKRHFRGVLKGPLNDSARAQAGLTQEYYSAIAH